MALYATKNAFSGAVIFVDYVQNRRKRPFGHFFRGKKADLHFTKAVQTARGKCATALVCRKDKSLCKGICTKKGENYV